MKPRPLQTAILAGGSGTRFWPAGRQSRPKQFLALDGDDPRPLLEATWTRVAPLTDAPPWVVAPASLRRALKRLLPDLSPESLLLEPRPRNTAAAVVLVALTGARLAPGVVQVVIPADQHVRPVGRYRSVLRAMASRARRSGAILTLGLRPTHAATGYGYLALGEQIASGRGGAVHVVKRFVEKPTPARAKRMVADGRHLWNGGTFAFLPASLLEEAQRHLPEVVRPLARAFDTWATRRFPAALRRAYEEIPSISVDHGIMERAGHVETVVADLTWDDLGSWDAVARRRRPDGNGTRLRGDVTAVDAHDCVVDAEVGHVALLGVEGLIVVRTRDTVLVAKRGRGESVRDVVARLRAEGREDLLR